MNKKADNPLPSTLPLRCRRKAIAVAVTAAVLMPQAQRIRAQEQMLEEVMVTASRRSQNIQDIPYNITALTGDTLATSRIFSMGDLARAVPGMSYVNQGPISRGNNNNFTMRGLNVQSASNNTGIPTQGAAAVSTYFGEIPVFYSLQLKDLERVEVLRGPQGTLYGSGSVGGTVRFIPNKPDLDQTEIEVEGSVGSTKDADDLNYSSDIVVNIPIVENTFAIRVAAGYEKQPGFIDGIGLVELDGLVPTESVPGDVNSGFNLAPQDDINDAKQYYGRLSALWDVNERLNLSFLYQHDHSKQDSQQAANSGAPGGIVNSSTGEVPGSLFIDNGSCAVAAAFPGNYYCGYGLPFPDGGSPFPASGDNENGLGKEEPYKSDLDLFNLDVNVDFGFATLTSSTSSYEVKEEYGSNVTGLFMPTTSPDGVAISSFYMYYPRLLDTEFNDTKTDGFVQELRLVSSWDKKWDYVVGAFYQDTDNRVEIDQLFPGITEFDQANFAFHANPDLGDQVYDLDRRQKFEDTAIFGEVTYHLTEAWQVTGGFRWFEQELKLDFQQQFLFCGAGCAEDAEFDGDGFPIAGDPLGTTTINTKNKVDDTIFKFNTSYDLNEDMMLYLTVAEGFRRGGANSISIAGPTASLPEYVTYDPDKVTNYEVGAKGVWEGMSYTVAVYLNDWKDFQFEDTNPSGFPYVINGDKAETKGIELEVSGAITDNLRYNIGYAYTDAEVTKDFTVDDLPPLGLSFDLPPIENAVINKGDKIPNVPKHSFAAGMDYSHSFFDSSSTMNWHLDAAYRDDVESGFNKESKFGVGYFQMDSFWTWNGSVRLEADQWHAGVFVTNITDKEGITGGLTESSVGTRDQYFYVARPRTVGLSFGYRFR